MNLRNNQVLEWIVGIAILFALAILINPFHLWMPNSLELTIAMILAVLVIGFSVFIWRERPRDEREAQHAASTGWVSYLAGGAVLLIAVLSQSLAHTLDWWVLVALGAMVVTKLIASALLDRM